LWFGPHVCDDECEGPEGCIKGKSEEGRFNRIQQAKRICEVCPEREPCAIWAIVTGQEFGIWGGLTERERNKIKRRMRENSGY
jgi:hypothetical protein